MTEQALATREEDEVQQALEFWRAHRATEAQKDLVTIADPLLKLDMIRDVSMAGDHLQRWIVRVPIYPKHQYLIRGRSEQIDVPVLDPEGRPRQRADGSPMTAKQWVSEWSAALRAEGYDWLNRVAGIQFYTPPTVVDREGREVLNPVHAPNYLLHAEVAVWYSETGQMIVEPEVVEIDLLRAWQAERLKRFQKLVKKGKSGGVSAAGPEDEDEEATEPAPAAPATELLVRDPESGAPRLGLSGELLFRLPDADEAAAGERLIQLQNFGLRMAKTIARRRLMMRLLAVRTVWSVQQAERPSLDTRFLWVTGWRDELTPDQRLERAQAEAKTVFGKAIEVKVVAPISEDEIATEPIDEAEYTEAVAEAPSAPASTDAQPAVIPGVTTAMPGEQLAKAVCGSRDVIGPNPCLRPVGHLEQPNAAQVHESKDGVWPAAR